MFERFTTQARGVVVDAQHEARQLNHAYIGTEHLLLALLREDSGLPHTVLSEAGLSLDEARASVTRILNESSRETSNPALDEDDAAALEAIGIDLDAIRAKIEETFGPGALDPPPVARQQGLFRRKERPARVGGRLPFTARAKKVLELSLREAIVLRHKNIGAEHILLGLLREGEGLGAKVIHDAGIDLRDVRRRVVASLEQAA
jgi:ATP-dependent Clp protease ATP-binding subunit ClpA